jgi:DNA-binding Xre family transcriptional regulator
MSTIIEKKLLKASDYNSPLLDELLAGIDPVESAKIEARMVIACKIADALTEKKMSKKELAQQLGQQVSTVTKWLSGKHNFNPETLLQISRILNIDFSNQEIIPLQVVKKYAVSTSLSVNAFA